MPSVATTDPIRRKVIGIAVLAASVAITAVPPSLLASVKGITSSVTQEKSIAEIATAGPSTTSIKEFNWIAIHSTI